jgi:hypothetical protein
VLSCVAALLAVSASAVAEESIVILPTGSGPGFVPTAKVARALARRLSPRPPDRSPVVRLAFPAPLPVPPTSHKQMEKQAAKLLKKALSAYELMEYDKVKAATDEALKIYKEILKGGTADEGYVACLHIIAASALLNGDAKDAFHAMNDAFVYDQRPPSKKQFNPSVQELFEQVRVESPGKGTVVLGSTPPALVWFNGVLHGLAQGQVRLRAGLYLARFYAPGHIPTQRWIRVSANQTRNLSATLTRDEGAMEDENLQRLREEVLGAEPGPTTNQLTTDYDATELILIVAGKACTEASCTILLRWGKEGSWLRRTKAVYVPKQADATAATLLGLKPPTVAPPPPPGVTPPPPPTAAACTYDSQCSVNEKCRGGSCARVTPLTHKWWFWTAIVAGAAAISLGVALPLTLKPEPSVIEVK